MQEVYLVLTILLALLDVVMAKNIYLQYKEQAVRSCSRKSSKLLVVVYLIIGCIQFTIKNGQLFGIFMILFAIEYYFYRDAISDTHIYTGGRRFSFRKIQKLELKEEKEEVIVNFSRGYGLFPIRFTTNKKKEVRTRVRAYEAYKNGGH